MIEIWNEMPKEPRYFLRFIKDKDWKDRASIIIVDKNGEKIGNSTILSFNEKGQIELYAGVDSVAASELGLTLDDDNCVVFTLR